MSTPNPDTDDASPPCPVAREEARIQRRTDRLEMLFTLIMAMAAIATAFAGFESSKWNSEQARLNTQAGVLRAQANRLFNEAGQLRSLDAIVFTQWLNALNIEIQADPGVYPGQGYQPREKAVSTFLYQRFRKEFRPAFAAWLEQQPLRNPEAPATPLVMPEYRLATQIEAETLLAEAEAKGDHATEVGNISTNFTRISVMFALVLFFVAVGNKATSRFARTLLFGLSLVTFVATLGVMLTFPIAP